MLQPTLAPFGFVDPFADMRPLAAEGYRRLSTIYREGDYNRVFTLSDEVDQSNIKAKFKNAVLRLELPRSVAAMPKKISVKAA